MKRIQLILLMHAFVGSILYANQPTKSQFKIPDTDFEFQITAPDSFTSPSNQKEGKNKEKILKTLNNSGVGNVTVVDILQTSWSSASLTPPSILIATNPSLTDKQGSITDEIWRQTKLLYQSMAEQAFAKFQKKTAQKNAKNDLDILFSDEDDKFIFTTLIENKLGQTGYGVVQLHYKSGCIFTISITAPPPTDYESIKAILAALEIE